MESNDIVVEAWNTVLFDKFVRYRHLLTTGLNNHSDACFRRRPPRVGSSLLDVGCGFGDTTVTLARAVGPTGKAAGVDCAENFIAEARRTAEREKQTNVSYFVADVQTDALGGPYDAAYARFGTMFFNLPGAAFRNVRRALAPGGTFTMIVWRKREDNHWIHAAEQCVRQIVPVVAHEDTDQVHCGPGPFSMAGPDRVSDLFLGAGYCDVVFERCDVEICIGRNVDEAIAFAMALGPAGEIMRLAGEEGRRYEPEVEAALRETLSSYQRPGGVWAPSSSWFVTATNPRV
jgi:ubiquinone/menaquinone biosynthesis C-methylase UbiE